MRTTSLGVLRCPDDAAGRSNPVTGDTLTTYAGCHHDVEAPIDATNHGVLFLNSHVGFDDIPDGLSYTLFIGEVARRIPWAGSRERERPSATPDTGSTA